MRRITPFPLDIIAAGSDRTLTRTDPARLRLRRRAVSGMSARSRTGLTGFIRKGGPMTIPDNSIGPPLRQVAAEIEGTLRRYPGIARARVLRDADGRLVAQVLPW